MATPNIGLLAEFVLKPINSDSGYPIVESNDVMGGIHLVNTFADISTIKTLRRQWGMLVYVKSEKKYYQLKPIGDETIEAKDSNNTTNWQEFSGGGSSTADWLDTVKGVYNESTNIPGTKNTDDRFLVGPNGSGTDFNGKSNQIAVYARYLNLGNGGFFFSEPSDGATLRVDNEIGVLYTFRGTSSATGNWYKEYQNTIRYIYPTSNNGLTFSYTSTGQHPLTGYTYCVFVASFATSNSGTMSLSIDGNAYTPIKKLSSNALTDLESGDLGANVQYQLTYDAGNFQVFLGGAGSGGTIGPAEDNDYGDGLYTDFTPSTDIGVPIDRFNQILKALVPPPAPNLRSWSVSPNSQFVTGKLSYAHSAEPGLGIISASYSSEVYGRTDATLTDSFVKGAFGGYRLGITSRSSQTETGDTFYQNITGILNSDVDENPNQPTPAYSANSIGNGLTGSLVLYLNTKTVSSVDLATYNSINTSGGANGGFILNAPTASKFSNGTPFETFWNRSGSYVINKTSTFFETGYNHIQVKHFLPTSTITLVSYEFLTDDSTSATTFNSPSVTYNNSATDVKTLSGIKYYTAFKANYSCTVNNIYRNTYSADADAVRFTDVSTLSKSRIYNNKEVNNNGNATVFTPQDSQKVLPNPTQVTDTASLGTSFTLIAGSARKVNGSATFSVTVKRTVQGTKTGGYLGINNLFIDNISSSSTDLIEDFCSEGYRKKNLTFDKVSDVTGDTWLTTASLLSTSGYRNALQVADGRLLYPFLDFEGPGDTNTNPNKGNVDAIYTTCKSSVAGAVHGSDNYRTYTRVFNLGSLPNQSRGNWTMKITYDSTTFVPLTSALDNNSKCYIEIKLPHDTTRSAAQLQGGLIGGASGPVTGWLDAVAPFDPAVTPTNGKGCNLTGLVPASGGTWDIQFGGRTTFYSGGVVLVRITAGKDWQGYIQRIELIP